MTKNTNKAQPLDVFTCDLSGISNIEASAGTGKTWAICGLYLRLIAEMGLKVDQVLMVTFTNSATAELRTRIRDRLVEVLHVMETGRCLSGDPFTEKFLQRINHLGGDVAALAGNRLKTALSSFEEAAIFTIHSFCQRSLGEVPFAAVQPFRVEVEANDVEVIRETAADYWRRIVDRYSADEINALMDASITPDWLTREFKRILGKPTARLLFPQLPSGADRASRRVGWLKRILLCSGPRAVRAAKRHRRVISYNDMLYNLYEALTGGHFPGLANELRSRFPVALIDEFQDTDPLQFEIFRSIYLGSGSLFLVGDPKQAIYAFRNADLNTYLVAKRYALRQWTLTENQRSEEGLICAVNAVCGVNTNVFCSLDIPYQNVARGTKPLQELTGDPESRAPLSVWLFDPGSKATPVKVGDAEQLVLNATAWEMSRLITGGMQGLIKIGSAPLQPRDIAVLVRTKKQGQAIKEVLAQYGIGSVDLTDRSVFATLEAEEMERVMRAIAEPARTGLIRAALSTVLMGKGSMELALLNSDEAAFNDMIERMDQYRMRWMQYGFGAMWRKLLTEEQVIERLLPEPSGERQITNLMHLMELLTAAEEKHHGIESLLRWLGERRVDPQEDEVTQLRLESDENLVQIVTKHRAKGLEWPIVFCPFIWQERGRAGDDGGVLTYHEGDQLILDYTWEKEGKSRQEEEKRAERVRLIYVALTRAINRCYIAAGPFWQPWGKGATETSARKSMMNWIVAGNEDQPGIGPWVENKKVTVASIHQAWQELLTSKQGIGQVPWPAGKAVSLPDTFTGKVYEAREVRRLPGTAWRLSSYSSLTASSREGIGYHEPETQDYDVVSGSFEDNRQEDVPLPTPETPSPDIIDFPAGITAGHCLHAVFERIDFQDDSRWLKVITDVLADYPPVNASAKGNEQAVMIRNMLSDVLNTELPGGFALRDVPCQRRLTELEFAFPVKHLDHKALNAFLDRHRRLVPKLTFPTLEGYLRGFVDLVFEHGGKWYVLDWKSNKTGLNAQDYSRERLNEEMFHHAYELQGLIYLTALHRYLKLRIPGYDYNVHMGGMFYLFVRGVKPAWPSAGIWHDLPNPALIESLDALFSSESARERGNAS